MYGRDKMCLEGKFLQATQSLLYIGASEVRSASVLGSPEQPDTSDATLPDPARARRYSLYP